jgi:outer membrane protein OmpA-like peptidoglycan-associated protein
MKTNIILTTFACAGFLTGCAHAPPDELVDARENYRRASTGEAARIAPAELHVAKVALEKAEHSFNDKPKSFQTRDLAYVAHRKALLAEAKAEIVSSRDTHRRANTEYRATQTEIAEDTQNNLNDTRAVLAASQRRGALTKEQLAEEQEARKAAEQKAADALAALARMTAVKEEPRGTVITLSGSVLFASNQATLLPAAQSRLDQVAAVLLSTAEREIVIEGHTDSRGSESHNVDLSQRRANAVRDYLVQKGCEPDRIVAHGLGESRPVATNQGVEGRANNRRVEIVLQRE